MIKKTVFLVNLFIILGGFCLSSIGADIFKIAFDPSNVWDAELGRFIKINEDSLATIEGWAPRLIGDYSHEILPNPSLIISLRLDRHASHSFRLKGEVYVVEHIFRFNPKASINTPHLRLPDLASFMATKPYYVAEIHGGKKKISFSLTYDLAHHIDLPDAEEFYGEGTEGMKALKAKLEAFLPTGQVFLSAAQLSTVGLPRFPNESLYSSIEEYLAEDSLQNAFFKKPFARPLSFDSAKIPQMTYDELDSSAYTHLSALNDLAKKYSLRVFKTLDKDGLIVCRIHLYLSERGDYSMVVRGDITWLHAEAAAASFEDALEDAFKKIKSLVEQN